MQGLNLDHSFITQPENTYRYALNTINESAEGDLLTMSNEQSNTLCLSLDEDILGSISLNKNEFVIFTNTKLYLFTPETCTATLIIECPELDIQPNVSGVYKLLPNCDEREIYWTDRVNPVRSINIDNTSEYLDCDLNIFKCHNPTEIEVAIIDAGGFLGVGVYQFAYRYDHGNVQFITSPVYITDESSSVSWEQLDGSVTGVQTTKAIKINVKYIDFDPDKIELIVVKTIGGVVSAEIIGEFNPTNDLQYIYNGVPGTFISLQELLITSPYYYKANIIAEFQDQLLIGKLTSLNNVDYQQLANEIEINWVTYKIPANLAYKYPEYMGLKTFMGDEVYAFGIVGEFCDGSFTPVFHIPGRTKNSLDALPVSATNPDNFYECDKEKWEVYNTATITETPHNESVFETDCGITTFKLKVWERGKMGYNEQCITYLDIKNCEEEIVYPVGNIRHHRMPDRALVPHFNKIDDPDVECYEINNDNAYVNGVRPYKGSILPDSNYEETFIYPIGIEVSNVKPMVSKIPITKYHIVYVERNETNKTIVAKGITHKCFGTTLATGNIALHPHYNINGTLLNLSATSNFNGSISAYSNVDNSNNIETEVPTVYKFHSPNTSYNKPYLGVNYFSVEQQWNGNGRCYGSKDKNELDETTYCGRFNFDMRNFSYNNDLSRPFLNQKNRKILNSTYVATNSVNTSFSKPFFNLHQESGVAFELKENLEFINPCAVCGPGVGLPFGGDYCYREFRDTSLRFIGDTCTDRLLCAQALYGSIKRILCNQYGVLEGLAYKVLNFPVRTITNEGNGEYTMEFTKIFGDAFINYWSYRRTAILHYNQNVFQDVPDDDDELPISTLVHCYYESDVNVDMRHEGITALGEVYYPKLGNDSYKLDTIGDNYTSNLSYLAWFHFNNATNAYVNLGTDNYFGYNNDFSTQNSVRTFFGFTEAYKTCECNSEQLNDIAVSEVSNWKKFRAANILTVPNTYGVLNNVFSLSNNLYAHTEDNLWKIFTAESKLALDANEVYIGHGDLFGAVAKYLYATAEGVAGLQKEYGTYTNQMGYHFFDNKAGILYRFSETVTPITEGLRNFFKNNKENEQYLFGYDYRHNRLLFTANHELDCKNYTLSYSDLSNSWLSFHSYIPQYYLQTRNDLFSVVNNTIWKHNELHTYQTFYNIYYPSIIEFVEKAEGLKIWDNITYIQDAFKFNVTYNTYMPVDETFTHAVLYNSTQSSGILRLSPHTDLSANYMTNAVVDVLGEVKVAKKERVWLINGFEDFVDDYTIPNHHYPCAYPQDFTETSAINLTKPYYNVSKFRDLFLVQRYYFNVPEKFDIKLVTSFLTHKKLPSLR